MSSLAPRNLSRLTACREAARALRASSAEQRNTALRALARRLGSERTRLLSANSQDLAALAPAASPAFRDRLTLNEARVGQIVESLNQVEALADPVGEVVETKTLSNGLKVRRVRSPLGVILMIFESRPNVAVEAFSLAFKSGNVIVLRGGKESMRTTGVIYELIGESLAEAGLPRECLWGITDPDRALTLSLLQERALIDVVVPRGGDSLIEFVVQNSRIPIIKNDRGLCHIYAHEDADQEMAVRILENSKCQRPGVCNSSETFLVHRAIAGQVIQLAYDRLGSVEWFGCPETLRILDRRPRVSPATERSWDTEYLDLKLNCRVVASLEQAIAHIERHGSRHSESIITRSGEAAAKFEADIDAAAVYWNASTRFTDGFELGLGGELGISTQKLHVRGPVGLRELTSVRWIIEGQGQTRS